MKLKTNFFYTLRENAKDEDSTSGNLLVRSGMIKKIGAGIYMFMPLGLRAFNNIKNIIKEEIGIENYHLLEQVKKLQARKGVQAMMPFEIAIH